MAEPYHQSSVPLAIYARRDLLSVKSNPVARIVRGEIVEVISKLRDSFGGEPKILCEGGPTLISALIQLELLDQLFLSRSTLNGESDFFDVDQTKKMLLVSSSVVLDHYRKQ